MGEIIGTVIAIALIAVVFVAFRGLSATVPLMPTHRGCPNCGEMGWEDFSLRRAFSREPYTLYRDLSSFKYSVASFVFMLFMGLGLFGVIGAFLVSPWLGLPASAAYLFGLVWFFRLKASQPVTICNRCGWSVPGHRPKDT